MMINKFEINEQDNLIYVFVELLEFCRTKKVPKFNFDTNDLLQTLKDKKIAHGELVSGPTAIRNWNLNRISGTWVFKKKTKAQTKKKTRRTKATPKKTTEE